MLEKIYLLLEILTVIICFNGIHSKKIRFDMNTVTFITLEIMFTEMVINGIISDKVYFIVYLLFFAYGYIEFNENIKVTVFSLLMSIIIVGYIQIFIAIPFYQLPVLGNLNEDILVLGINGVSLIVVLGIEKVKIFGKIYSFCKSKDWVLNFCMIVAVCVMVYCMYLIKDSLILQIDIVAIVIALSFCGCLFIIRWQQADNIRKSQKAQLKIANFYGKEFSELVDISRKRQHDLKNQISALRGMNAINSGAIPEEQKAYEKVIEDNNKILKILNSVEQPVLAGFLYNRFCSMLDKNINVDCNLAVTSDTLGIEIYDCIEILGILLDNAQEAVESNNLEKKIFLEVICYDGNVKLLVRNVSRYYENDEIAVFFRKGYSSKGKYRGIGLAKVRDLQKKYGFDIMVQMETIKNEEWLVFRIIKEKRTVKSNFIGNKKT